jgi:Ca-activated chloride channel family protein
MVIAVSCPVSCPPSRVITTARLARNSDQSHKSVVRQDGRLEPVVRGPPIAARDSNHWQALKGGRIGSERNQKEASPSRDRGRSPPLPASPGDKSSPPEELVKVSANLDLNVVALEQPDELTVLVEMAAPDADNEVTRAPATLQIVLDRSGSMGGGRLDGAKIALLKLVDRLAATDNFGVVAFDDNVQVVVPAGPVSNKPAVKVAIAQVSAGNSTDLSAGLLRGLQEARRAAGPAGATLLLISDGHANAGITDPGRLGEVAAEAHGHGITTSTLGFGLGYDERLLAALARGGRGNEHFAEEPDTATALISGEVQGLLEQVAQAASLVIRMEPPVESLYVLNELPITSIAGGVMAELGSFYAGEARKVVLRFTVPGLPALGLHQIATLELLHVSLPDLVQHTATLPVHVNVVPGDQAAGRVADPTVTAEALYQTTQRAKRQGGMWLSEGRIDEAVQLLRDTSDDVRRQAEELPSAFAAELGQEAAIVGQMAAEAASGFSARAAKSASYDASFKSRTRGRRTIGGTVLRWVDDPTGDRTATYLLADWQLQRLRRELPPVAQHLSAHDTGVRDEQVAHGMVPLLNAETDPLRQFLLGAASHGGFTVEQA